MTNSKRDVHSGAVKVQQPYYQETKKKLTTVKIATITLVVAGVSYWLGSQSDPAKNITPQQQKKGGIKAASVLGGTALVTSTFTELGKKKKNIPVMNKAVNESNFNNWLSDYNRKQNQNYVKAGQDSYGYLIVPKNQLSAYNAEEKRRQEEAERQRVLAEQRRKEQEERDRIARIEREEQERKAQIEREVREKREREVRERAERDMLKR